MNSRIFKKTALALSLMAVSTVAAVAGVGVADKERIANEGTIGDKWMLADGVSLVMPEYPPYLSPTGANVCMAIGYLINEDGVTSDFAVLNQWNSKDEKNEPVDGFWQGFATAGADALAQWRFKPRPEVKRAVPTWTVATLTFSSQSAMDAAALRGHCAVKDLKDSIERTKASRMDRGDIAKQYEENKQIQIDRARREADLRRANGG